SICYVTNHPLLINGFVQTTGEQVMCMCNITSIIDISTHILYRPTKFTTTTLQTQMQAQLEWNIPLVVKLP
ncbi:hypothetical protein NDU88_003796, partial [Pleurodeles waltl]